MVPHPIFRPGVRPRLPRPGPWLGLLPLLLATGLLATGCGPETAASSTSTQEVQREVRELMTAVTPLKATALPVEKNSWHKQRKATLERMRTLGKEYGLEALRIYREEPPALPEVRIGLLDVAAHCAPAETSPLLVQLTTVFGEDILVRTKATEFLGECAPAQAVELLEPILHNRYDGRTYPPEERLLEAYVAGCEHEKHDPVPLLCTIATDVNRPQDVRHLATRTLARFDAPQSRQALQALMVESSGNGYIRRVAAQSLQQLLPKEEFCAYVLGVQQHEADPEYIGFLESVLTTSCR